MRPEGISRTSLVLLENINKSYFYRVGKEAEDEHDGPTDSETSVEYVKLHGSSEGMKLSYLLTLPACAAVSSCGIHLMFCFDC